MWHRLVATPKPICCTLRPPRLPWKRRELLRWSSTAKDLQPVPEQWSPSAVKSVLEQVADAGALQGALHARLHNAAVSSASEEGLAVENTDDSVECGMPDFLLALELCKTRRLRDFVLFSRLAERLVLTVPQASTGELIRLSSAFAALGALNQPLFDTIAQTLLAAWPDGSAPERPVLMSDTVQVARAFAAQRSRHTELFDRMMAVSDVPSATPSEALSLLHSIAFLRLDREFPDDLWKLLEQKALEPGLESLGPGPLSQLCQCLFLAGRSEAQIQDIVGMVDAIAGAVLETEDSSWSDGEGPALHRRLLLLRSALRYLHREAYQELSPNSKLALRKVHRLDPPMRDARPTVHFVRKLSHILTKIKVGHFVNAERGPFTLDAVERDRKLIYECNHFDRFYSGSTEKIASSCLQERIVKAMGYRVVQIPHWQWNKVRRNKQRIEYIRMSRYYAIKDRREYTPRDEAPADTASNVFDYLGEYFFRKERPAASWSWFQPRYDASKRVRNPDGP